MEIDLEAIDRPAGERRREARLADDREKEPLELGVREGEGLAVEQRAQHCHARPTGSSVQRLAELLGIHEVEHGFRDGRVCRLIAHTTREAALADIEARAAACSQPGVS